MTLTPTAARWLGDIGEVKRLARVTGFPVRWQSRLPTEASGHPETSLYVAAPATANTVAKLALGIADNQAMTALCEAIGAATPIVLFPRVNAALARQPAWDRHLDDLRSAGVHLLYGEDVWPLFEPGEAPSDRELPWSKILDLVCRITES